MGVSMSPPTSEGTTITDITGAHEPTRWHRDTRAPGPRRSVARESPLGGGRIEVLPVRVVAGVRWPMGGTPSRP
jgi:hypothetical protein